MSADCGDTEQVELQMQDENNLRLRNQILKDNNARLNSENTRLQQENERLKKESLSQTQLYFQFVFIGDSAVGKTTFIRRVCEDKFLPQCMATIGVDFQSRTMVVGGRQVLLHMWDTAGQERFQSMTRQFFRKADVAVVMYDVTSEVSFKNVHKWMRLVKEGCDDATIVAIIGNKQDLILDGIISREVATADGAKLAKEFNAFFYETSAKTNQDVDNSLLDIVSLLIESTNQRERRSQPSTKTVKLDQSPQPSTSTSKGCSC